MAYSSKSYSCIFDEFLFTGTILNSNWIKCLNYPPNYFQIRANAKFKKVNSTLHKIDYYIENTNYWKNKFPINDIVLAKIILPFEFNGKLQPIELIDSKTALKD